MARRRMYLFERAYVDYADRVRQFRRRLMSLCGNIWNWWWRGTGANVIEILLRVLIVLSAVAMAYLYIRYEKSQGRGFSAGTLGVMAVIIVYVSVLLWGWKAPVHFVARLLSGTSAAGIVLVLAVAAGLAATGIFSIYLVLLFALTALSFVIFLPMRGGQELWLLYRRIAYRCPYDDCSYSGLPIHICEGGEEYPDLLPSFYGIFHHTCRHNGKSVQLPTMDILGRNKLSRLCGGCKRRLIHSSLGELPEWPIAVMGGTSAGKTIFLLQATNQLSERLAGIPGSTVRIDSKSQEKDYRDQVEQLSRGEVVAKTAGDVIPAFGLTVRVPKQYESLLYLFDAPGEHFAAVQRMGQKQMIQHLRGVVLLVDPFSLPVLAPYANHVRDQLKPSEMQFRDVVANLIQTVNLMIVRRPDEKCTVPLAVVLSKADALPEGDYPFLHRLCSGDGRTGDGDGLSQRCREALEKLGEGFSIRALEQKFEDVRYFACSALGRMPDLRTSTPFQAAGVVEPLLWLLNQIRPMDKNQ